jgi:hypothetical protein
VDPGIEARGESENKSEAEGLGAALRPSEGPGRGVGGFRDIYRHVFQDFFLFTIFRSFFKNGVKLIK